MRPLVKAVRMLVGPLSSIVRSVCSVGRQSRINGYSKIRGPIPIPGVRAPYRPDGPGQHQNMRVEADGIAPVRGERPR